MYNLLTLNKIAKCGLDNFDKVKYEKESDNLLGTVGSRKKYNCETSFGQIQLP